MDAPGSWQGGDSLDEKNSELAEHSGTWLSRSNVCLCAAPATFGVCVSIA